MGQSRTFGRLPKEVYKPEEQQQEEHALANKYKRARHRGQLSCDDKANIAKLRMRKFGAPSELDAPPDALDPF
eukprot:7970199-Lingulodinium_polyedra.AAC.1